MSFSILKVALSEAELRTRECDTGTSSVVLCSTEAGEVTSLPPFSSGLSSYGRTKIRVTLPDVGGEPLPRIFNQVRVKVLSLVFWGELWKARTFEDSGLPLMALLLEDLDFPADVTS